MQNQRPTTPHHHSQTSHKPTYNYGDAVRPPQQWDHETNHLSNPTSGFYSSNAQRPIESHRPPPSVSGLVSGDGLDYGVDSDDLFAGWNNGNVYANGQQHYPAAHSSSDDGVYRPVLGKFKESPQLTSITRAPFSVFLETNVCEIDTITSTHFYYQNEFSRYFTCVFTT